MARGGEGAEMERVWTLSAPAVEKWLEKARSGDQVVYARGDRLHPSDGVRALQVAHDEGRVTFKQVKHAEFDRSYIAQRCADPRRPGPAQRLARPIPSEDNDEIALLMAALRRRAARSEPMGTNRELGEDIAELAGMSAPVLPDRVAYLLRKQISAGRLRVEAAAIGCRVATIVATGKRTALVSC